MANLVRMSKVGDHIKMFSKHTIARWRADGKHPQLFRKIGGKVFIDLDEFEKMVNGETNEKQ